MTIPVTLFASTGAGSWACALALPLGLALMPGAARACLPPIHDIEEPTLFEGEAGEAYWKHDGYEVTGVSRATDLGDGYVVQHLTDGNVCYGEASTVVSNCVTGEAVAFGGRIEAFAPGRPQEEILEELDRLIEERARLAHHLTIAEISATAAARGVGFVVPMPADSLVRLGAFEVRLSGCRLAYPGLPGGTG